MDRACCVGIPVAFTPDPEADERVAALCKALAHPARVHIVRFLLAQRACFAGEIAGALPLAASTVSQHLAQLREAGVIRGEVDGPRRCYEVDPAAIDLLRALLAGLTPALECSHG